MILRIPFELPFRIEWFLIVTAIPVSMLAYYLLKLGGELRIMKQECTLEVPAVITALRKGGSAHGMLGRRGVHYNADYQYEYDGTIYESHNSIYGQKPGKRLKVGDTVTIRINPFEPTELFDPYAEASMCFYFVTGIEFGFIAWVSTIGQIVIQLVWR